MKSVTILCLLVALSSALPQNKYTDRYDNIDLDEILGNRRLLVPYVKCMLDQGPCTPEGKELRTHIADALETDCSKCTEKQKDGTKRVIKHLADHEAEYWKQLRAKYDPENRYSKKYEEEIKN
uniref:Chemosensory protein n=2 Tax=Neoptera TaxID=33340 RepID=A0A6M9BJK0_9NEOP|nr:chemosensory protein [Histia rhodope]